MATIVRENPNPPGDTSDIPDHIFELLQTETLEKIAKIKIHKEQKKIIEEQKKKENLEIEAKRQV